MKNYKAYLAIIHDSLVAGSSVVLAMFFRLGQSFFNYDADLVLAMTLVFLCVAIPVFLSFGLYRTVWQYASVVDVIQIIKASTVSVLLFLAAMYLLQYVEQVPRSIPVIQWFLLIVLLGGPRIAFRTFRQRGKLSKNGNSVPVLMLGMSDNAEQFIRASQTPFGGAYRVVGILDESLENRGRRIHGVPILGKLEQLENICTQLASRGRRPQRLVMADPASVSNPGIKRHLLGEAEKQGLTVARLPSLADLKDTRDDGRVDLNPIALEDLLGRPQARLDRDAINDLVTGRRILVTGAGGTIGSELSRQITALSPKELVLLDFSEFNLYSIEIKLRELEPKANISPVLCNIRDRHAVEQVFRAHRPELVFHAAALKHVPMVERNPAEGVLTNVIGTQNLVDAAHGYGTQAMVQVSTDKAINPTSMMGATKRLAEFYCQSLDIASASASEDAFASRFMTVRFGNVLGSSGSVVPLFQRQLARGGPLTVTHPDMSRYFMTVREAVELVLQASAHGTTNRQKRGQIFVLDMSDPIKIVDIANQMIRLSGLRPGTDIKIEFTGLRPGEKLFEELFDHDEQRLPAVVDGVQVATSRSIELKLLRNVFAELGVSASRGDEAAIRRLIGHVLPSFAVANTNHQQEVSIRSGTN